MNVQILKYSIVILKYLERTYSKVKKKKKKKKNGYPKISMNVYPKIFKSLSKISKRNSYPKIIIYEGRNAKI